MLLNGGPPGPGYGRVQGVSFRQWTGEKALGLGIRGWVRNRRDGSVELVACGGDQAVEALVAACRTGPPAARVERIEVEGIEGNEPASGFRILETG